MLNMIENFLRWLTAPSDFPGNAQDVLGHPAIEAMNQRELADLPFSRRDISTGNTACAA
jgi:hypothetical protein